MAYYYVEDIDSSLFVVNMIQTCSKYFPVPTVTDGEDLQYKLRTLNKLYTMWIEEQLNDSSYQSEIYKRICGKLLKMSIISKKKIVLNTFTSMLKNLVFYLVNYKSKINFFF